MLGFRIHTEVRTNQGRIDAVIYTDSHIYIFEFKLFDTAEAALQQIKDKHYYQRFLLEPKTIVLIGAAFDKSSKNLSDHFLLETIEPKTV
jgi:hypothetical protein